MYGPPNSYTPRHLAEKILTSKSALEGERKQVTVLFCDIVGSTSLAAQVGAEAMHRHLDEFFDLALRIVHRYEGTINQFLGDGFMALFGAPLAHEDHPRRAVLAALDFQRELGSKVGIAENAVRIRARIGVNTGTVIVGKIGDDLRMDYTAIGDTVNVAARLQHAAESDGILLSDSTRRAVSDYVDCRPLPAIQVKGKVEPILVFEPYRIRPADEARKERFQASGLPFVAREKELGVLTELLANLTRGCGSVVVVIGEPGIGKSRLLAEARRRHVDSSLPWFEGAALSFGQMLSYWPFLDVVRSCAGIGQTDDEEQSWIKLERRITALFPKHEVVEILPYLGIMLGLAIPGQYRERVQYLDGLAMGHQISRSSRRFFEQIAKDTPTVLMLEDWHWADESSISLLEHLIPLQSTVPLLFCIATRVETKGKLERLRSAGQNPGLCYREILLAPLASEPAAAIAATLLGAGSVSSQLRDFLTERAGGNPFFLEELVKSLQEIGAFSWDEGTRHWRMRPEFAHAALPSTLEGLLLARIDRLDDALKQVLLAASVIGRAFLYRVLHAIADSDANLEPRVAGLKSADLIHEKRLVPEMEYIFKHALIQEAAYESILTERRRTLHRRVGHCLELIFADRLDEFYPVLAFHYAKSEEWHKAQEYLFKAGDKASSIAADAEALAHYERALAVFEQASVDKLNSLQHAALDRKIGEALFRRAQHDEALRYLKLALAHLGEPYPASRNAVRKAILKQIIRRVFRSWFPVSGGARGPADKAQGDINAERYRLYELISWMDHFLDRECLLLDALMMLSAAERSQRGPELASALAYWGLMFDILGRYGRAKRHHLRAVELAEAIGHPGARGHSFFTKGYFDFYTGDWHAAIENFQRSASIFHGIGFLRHWAASLSNATSVMIAQGQFSGVVARGEEISRIGRDAQDLQTMAWGASTLGKGFRYIGRYEDAAAEFEKAIGLCKAIPDYKVQVTCLSGLAACSMKLGEMDKALLHVEQSHQLISQWRIQGHFATRPTMDSAELYLYLAEYSTNEKRVSLLHKAGHACKAAAIQGKRVRDEGAPDSFRLCGIYAWISGNRSKAERLWREGIDVAERLGAQYVLAQTHLELGRRLNHRPHLLRAEALFLKAGAQADYSFTQQFLSASQDRPA